MNYTITKGGLKTIAEACQDHTIVSIYFDGELMDKIPVNSTDIVQSAEAIMSGATAMFSTKNQLL